MTRELNNLALAFMLGFCLVALSSAYWSILQHDDLLTRSDNPRRIAAEQTFPRGMIVDRNGLAIASSRPRGSEGIMQRIYPYDEAVGAIGYYSHQYGADGLEAAFDDVLVGEYGAPDEWRVLWNDLLDRETPGYDLRSTIDLRLQVEVTQVLGNHAGAAIVLHVPTGQILAMSSQPSPDPNVIDLNWDELNALDTQTPRESPLLNRALRGTYQPGTAIQPALMVAMLAEGEALTQRVPDISRPVILPELSSQVGVWPCLFSPGLSTQLVDAFAHTCPRPFVGTLGTTLSAADYRRYLSQFGFMDSPPLYRMETGRGNTRLSPDLNVQLEAMGQGQLTITPFQMALFVAAIANNGSPPYPHLANAYRPSDEVEWRPFDIPFHSPVTLPEAVIPDIRQALRLSASVLFDDVSPTWHGHLGTAYSGVPPRVYSWFQGFVDLPDDGAAIVLIIVIEGVEEPEAAADAAAPILARLDDWRD